MTLLGQAKGSLNTAPRPIPRGGYQPSQSDHNQQVRVVTPPGQFAQTSLPVAARGCPRGGNH